MIASTDGDNTEVGTSDQMIEEERAKRGRNPFLRGGLVMKAGDKAMVVAPAPLVDAPWLYMWKVWWHAPFETIIRADCGIIGANHVYEIRPPSGCGQRRVWTGEEWLRPIDTQPSATKNT